MPEMRLAKKGSDWHFGMKLHVGVDKVRGVIHSVTTTAAKVHNITQVDKLRCPTDWEVIGDA